MVTTTQHFVSMDGAATHLQPSLYLCMLSYLGVVHRCRLRASTPLEGPLCMTYDLVVVHAHFKLPSQSCSHFDLAQPISCKMVVPELEERRQHRTTVMCRNQKD